MKLSDAKIRNLSPKAKQYKVADGEGLTLVVKPNGTKLWWMSYRHAGKQKTLSIGSYPKVTLSEARRTKDDAKALIENGQDPSRLKQLKKRQDKIETARNVQTFKDVADRWYKLNQRKWVPSYSVRIWNRISDDVLPVIGSVPIKDISPQDVLEAIRRIEKRDAIEMARRIYYITSNVFKFAMAEGLVDRNPTDGLLAALAPAKPPKHRAAIADTDLGEFLSAVENYDGDRITALALKMVTLTLLRTNELLSGEWSEITDLEGKHPMWRIPADKMKMRRDHIIPLSPQAVAVLKEVKRIRPTETDLIFTCEDGRNKAISNNTMIYAVYRMGFKSRTTVHGLRATASTILNENDFNRDWIEAQLAHKDNSIRGVYNVAAWVVQRKQMLKWWADYLDAKVREFHNEPTPQIEERDDIDELL